MRLLLKIERLSLSQVKVLWELSTLHVFILQLYLLFTVLICLPSYLQCLKHCCKVLASLFCKLHLRSGRSFSWARWTRVHLCTPGILGHSSLQILSSSVVLDRDLWWPFPGLTEVKSGLSHWRTFTELSLSRACVVLAVSLGSLSCEKANPQSHINLLSILIYHAFGHHKAQTGRTLTWCLTFWDFVPSAHRISGAPPEWAVWSEPSVSGFDDGDTSLIRQKW